MILIIDKHKRNAQMMADIFYYMGILSKGITPYEAGTSIYPAFHAILIVNPDGIVAVDELVEKIKHYAKSTPIFSISDNPDNSYSNLFDMNFSNDVYSSDVATAIINYQFENGLREIGRYKLNGVEAMCEMTYLKYNGQLIRLTRTEMMIVRFLLVSFPQSVSSNDILNYAFKPTKAPTSANVRTHISLINKKFSEANGKCLIKYLPAKGYVINTPKITLSLLPV